jgi:ABC-type multidrug transport system permease subunit
MRLPYAMILTLDRDGYLELCTRGLGVLTYILRYYVLNIINAAISCIMFIFCTKPKNNVNLYRFINSLLLVSLSTIIRVLNI